MKFLFSFCFLFPISAIGWERASAWDSVAVFVRPEKSVVMIHEPKAGGRLKAFMKLLSNERNLLVTSPDDSIKIDCGLGEAIDSCVFRFLPSEQVQISKKEIRASLPIDSLESLLVSFKNSNGDYFELNASHGELFFVGLKR